MKSVFSYRLDELCKKLPGDCGEVAISVAEEAGAITELYFHNHMPAAFAKAEMRREQTRLIKEAAAQLKKYFAGKLRDFSLPLAMRGTEFQKSVWQALEAIPYGETRSYKEIAALVGRPSASRAVGMANNRNPVSIIVPCHRVLGHSGALVGYGAGLPLKVFLLALEESNLF